MKSKVTFSALKITMIFAILLGSFANASEDRPLYRENQYIYSGMSLAGSALYVGLINGLNLPLLGLSSATGAGTVFYQITADDNDNSVVGVFTKNSRVGLDATIDFGVSPSGAAIKTSGEATAASGKSIQSTVVKLCPDQLRMLVAAKDEAAAFLAGEGKGAALSLFIEDMRKTISDLQAPELASLSERVSDELLAQAIVGF